jgi:hypothetical protein
MVLEACPDIVDYARHGIGSWRDFLATAGLVRSALGISPSAWEDARAVLGEEDAAVMVAAILQRGEAIKSPGGYLRSLTDKGRAGGFLSGRCSWLSYGTNWGPVERGREGPGPHQRRRRQEIRFRRAELRRDGLYVNRRSWSVLADAPRTSLFGVAASGPSMRILPAVIRERPSCRV